MLSCEMPATGQMGSLLSFTKHLSSNMSSASVGAGTSTSASKTKAGLYHACLHRLAKYC